MVGKVKMKSWQASIRKWEKNTNNQIPESKGTNLGEPPPEIFGIPSESSMTYEQYKNQRK